MRTVATIAGGSVLFVFAVVTLYAMAEDLGTSGAVLVVATTVVILAAVLGLAWGLS